MAEIPSPDQGHIVQGLRRAADNVEQHLARWSGLEVGQVAILMHLDLHQPATIPDVAVGVGAEGTAGPGLSWRTFAEPG